MHGTEDSLDYIYMLLMIENNSSGEIRVYNDYNSLSVNGFMTDYLFDRECIAFGKCALVDVYIDKSDLEHNMIFSLEEITDVELSLEIQDENQNTIATPMLSVAYQNDTGL